MKNLIYLIVSFMPVLSLVKFGLSDTYIATWVICGIVLFCAIMVDLTEEKDVKKPILFILLSIIACIVIV